MEPARPAGMPWVPVISLSLFAVAAGYLMSLIPLALAPLKMPPHLAAWLASAFYGGLLLGATFSARIVGAMKHRAAFVLFLSVLLTTIAAMAAVPGQGVWLVSRFIAGVAVAGIFVVVESWLLMADDDKQRAKRLGFYMTSLYGGNALGQLGIGYIGVEGLMPYVFVGVLIALAILPPLFFKHGEPQDVGHVSISFSELKKLRKAAYIGCLVSGLTLGAVYGLLPVYLNMRVADHQQVGALMALVVVGGMVVQPVVSYLSGRMSKVLLMAMFCIIGSGAVAVAVISQNYAVMAGALLVLGAAVFALYPIAITHGCTTLTKAQIVAATEVLLLSYSVGSVIGPVLADNVFESKHGIMVYLAACMISTAVYMIIVYFRDRRHMPNLSAA
ncbi:MFS transporter [Parasalinivibrio latis]